MFPIPDNNNAQTRYLTYEQMNLINAFRTINSNQAIYGKFLFDCIARDSPCFEAAYSRLLLVPQELFQIFSNYYSEEDAAGIYRLMMQDAIIMRNLADSVKDRDNEKANALLQQWHDNIDKLSDLYAGLNPYWSRTQWHELLYRQMQLTYQEMIASITDECPRAIEIFDRLRTLGITIGDYQARGIMHGLTEIIG